MMSYAATRLSSVKPSASAQVSERAKSLKAAGHGVIDLGLGEPDFDTPDHIIDAAFVAARNGQTRYPPTGGTSELKSAVSAKFHRDNALAYDNDEVIISNGAKQVIFAALMASMEPGQEVILCAPYFGSYNDIVLIQGGVPRTVECSAATGFRLTPESLEAAITPATRWLFLNSPSNPTGAVYSEAQLQGLGEVLLRHPQILILSDEIYEHILFDGLQHSAFAAACPELRDRTLTVNGVSKAYAMTGWRIGYGAGHRQLIAAMTKVQSQISSGACSVAQAAAVAALNGPQREVSRFRTAFEQRRNRIVSSVATIEGLTLDAPSGAFYAYIGCASMIGAILPTGDCIEDDVAFTQYLLDKALVAAVPGSAYGLSPFFRLSTAASEDTLVEAMTRIADCIKPLTLKHDT